MEELLAKYKELLGKEVPNNKKNDEDWIKSKIEEAEKSPKTEKQLKGDYIMTVTHLAWGLNGKNHFYADKKPLINVKVMGNYSGQLKVWLEKGWIKEGSYK